MTPDEFARQLLDQLRAFEDEKAVIARGLAKHNAEMDLLSMSDEERAAWHAKLGLPQPPPAE